MRYCTILLLCTLFSACDQQSENVANEQAEPVAQAGGTDSFNVRNDEIREDMIRMLDEENIEYSVEGDSIVYNLADGEAIDRIGNEAISEYITRN